MTLPRVRSVDREPIVYNDNEPTRGMSYWVYVTLSCHNWKRNDFHYSRHEKKTTFIGVMELVSFRCNRDFTSASSYGLGWLQLSDTSSIPPMHGGFLFTPH